MIDKVKGFLQKCRITKYIVMLISFLIISILMVVLSVVFSDAVLAYNVQYDGNVVAQVENKEVFDDAKNLAKQRIASANADNYLENPDLLLTITLPNRIDDKESTADAILENSSHLIKCVSLNVEGVQVAFYKDRESLQEVLNKKLNKYNIEGYDNKTEFVQQVDITDVYCPDDEYSTEKEILDIIENLTVRTTVKVTRQVSVGYNIVTKKSDQKLVGYYYVSQKGVAGLNQNVENVVYINGKEIKRIKLKQEVLRKPVNEVVIIGTAGSGSSSGMTFPLPAGTRYVITTYFGGTDAVHSTPHKGIDYGAPQGTSILAAKSGTVVYAGNNGNGYGYHVIINHGNGMRTVYAHASRLLVKKGEAVTQGQIIAKVGSTGNSTGPHLHFEVIINGRYMNPAIYVH